MRCFRDFDALQRVLAFSLLIYHGYDGVLTVAGLLPMPP
jgi:hypothetical protein